MKKYELTDEKITHYKKTLYRIRALKDFGNVKNGNLGGWIESEENLSHEGNAEVYDNAKIFDNAKVFGNAWVYGEARISGNAVIYGKV